jgi:antitoxin ParD1/3/4
MRSTQQFNIMLRNEMAAWVKAKVESGEYTTESEVIREGLCMLIARDRDVEVWLREQVVPAAKALRADSSRGIPLDKVRAKNLS